MRTLMIAAAALLAVAAPGVAAAETGGHIKFTYASIDGDDQFDDFCEGPCDISSDGLIALSGVVVTDVTDNWRVQFNGASADVDTSYFGNDFSRAYSQVEVHATRAVGMFDVGVFGGMFNNEGSSFYIYGAEAAANFERGRVTLSVAGATSPNSDSDFYDDITTVAASGTFNLTENIHVGATVSNTDFGGEDFSFFGDREVTSYGVMAAYDIPNSDFTVGVGYRQADSDFGDVDFFGVSLAWTFGEGSRGRVMPGAEALIPDAVASFDGFFVS
jgi:hypothetical protein